MSTENSNPEEAQPPQQDQHQPQAPTARQVISRGVDAWERDDFEAAYEYFERVLSEHPGFADVHNKAGLCLAMMGEVDRALEQFDLALGVNEAYAEAHLNRAIVLNELGRFGEAKKAFARASELDTRDSRVFPSDVGNKLAIAHARTGDLYLVADRAGEAAKEYSAALQIRPRFADIRSKLAEALLELDRPEDAVKHLERILEEKPGFTGARVKLGVALRRMGDDEGARREWTHCQDEDPEDMRIRAFLAALDRGETEH
jgi:tetratricopeptide (TPR) repeat protein